MSDKSQNKPTAEQDEATIRGLIDNWSKALEARDVAALTANYAPGVVLFDAIPPYKTEGPAAIRKTWESCLPFFPETFRSEHRDITIHAGGDVAIAHCLHHNVPTPADHPCGATWMRVTIGFRRIDGAWKVVHEHVSIPFNPMDGQSWYITDPDELSMPDYGAAPAS